MKRIVVATICLLFMFGCGNKYPDLGEGYRIIYSGGGPYLMIINSKNSVIINEHVLDFAFDSVFIIAAQRPFDSVPECIDDNRRYTDCRKAILKTSTFKQYWIIDKTRESVFIPQEKKHSKVFGPFNRDQYLMKRKELGVSDCLILKADIY